LGKLSYGLNRLKSDPAIFRPNASVIGGDLPRLYARNDLSDDFKTQDALPQGVEFFTAPAKATSRRRGRQKETKIEYIVLVATALFDLESSELLFPKICIAASVGEGSYIPSNLG
jgi:hypothetical protein